VEKEKQSVRLGRPPKQGGRDTRRCILEVALKLFAEQGFAGTSIRQIAREIGVKESTIYVHFENKDAICKSFFKCIVTPAALIHELLGSEGGEGDPETIFREVARLTCESWKELRSRQLISLILREGMLRKPSSLLLEAIEQIQQELGPLVQRWIEQGLVRADFPACHLIFEFFTPLVNIRHYYWQAQSSEEDIELGQQKADLHVEYFLRTVLVTPPTLPEET
jgi:AcrR family transcriptional regulator